MFCYNPRDDGGDSIRSNCGSKPWTPNFILFGETDQADPIIRLYGYNYTISNPRYSTNWFLHENVMKNHLIRQSNFIDLNIPGNLGMNPKLCCFFYLTYSI